MTDKKLLERVPELLASKMSSVGYTARQIANATRLWADFTDNNEVRARKPETYAAGVEYAIARMDFLEEVNQKEVGERYGISVASVSQTFQELSDGLGLMGLDPRYSTHPAAAEAGDMFQQLFEAMMHASGMGPGGPRGPMFHGVDEEGWEDEEPEPLELAEERLAAIKKLPQLDEEWELLREALPIYVREPEPVRPDIIAIANREDGTIVHMELHKPSPEEELDEDLYDSQQLEALAAAMLEPKMGKPHRPGFLVVEDEWLAERLEDVLDELDIRLVYGDAVVIPDFVTEFLDEMGMATVLPEPSYLEDGSIEPEVVADLFEAANTLWQLAPWKEASDTQLLQIELDRLIDHPLTAVLIGNAGMDFGLLLFEDASDFTTFLELAMSPLGAVMGPGVRLLSLNFEPTDALPPTMRKEAMEHGWKVASPRAYPLLMHTDPDGVGVPLRARTYQLVTAATLGLVRYLQGRPGLFEQEAPRQTSQSYTLDELPSGVTVTVTAPHPESREVYDTMGWYDRQW